MGGIDWKRVVVFWGAMTLGVVAISVIDRLVGYQPGPGETAANAVHTVAWMLWAALFTAAVISVSFRKPGARSPDMKALFVLAAVTVVLGAVVVGVVMDATRAPPAPPVNEAPVATAISRHPDVRQVTHDLARVSLGHVEIKGRIQTWSFTKVCLDGQAYLLADGVTGPNGIAPVYRDGKPLTCTPNPKEGK